MILVGIKRMGPVIVVDLEVTLIRKVSLLLIWSNITRLQIMNLVVTAEYWLVGSVYLLCLYGLTTSDIADAWSSWR